MIYDGSTLVKSDVWTAFIEAIDRKIFEFSVAKSALGYTHALFARCAGYYGPKGEFILNSTIIRMLADEQDSLAGSLHRTVHDIIMADVDSFDEYDGDSELISLQDFISFILVPFAAALLIAEDFDIDLEDADNIRDASNEYVDALQPDNDIDKILENLHEKNINTMKDFRSDFLVQRPRALRITPLKSEDSKMEVDKEDEDVKPAKARALSMKDFKIDKPTRDSKAVLSNPNLEKPGKPTGKAVLTVDDFSGPDPVTKKAGKKKKTDKKPGPSALKVKKNIVVSDYRTRATSKTRET
ncbi:hypothetical protein K438DRAFT_1955713 [Mycena galopus ATCC 62051]|nr:hypothetical protein K438DRAFT_1955713 [Mycena galopus ATCC 62051]